MKTKKIALAGNPNSGKTTIFNALTGGNQKTGNYPGVTVEKKEGKYSFEQATYEVIDLPGIYSLSTNSPEEIIARDVLIKEKPDLVVNIIDTSNLERNLYLTVQLLEMNVPVLMCFNMWDIVENKGIKIDIKKIKTAFGAEIVPVVGHKGIGIKQLKKTISLNLNLSRKNLLHYSGEAEKLIEETLSILPPFQSEFDYLPEKWFAIKLLEQDDNVRNYFREPKVFQAKIKPLTDEFERRTDEDTGLFFAEQRYGFISGVCQNAVISNLEFRHTISDKIDTVLTNKYLGLPIFFVMMYFVFNLTFRLGDPLMGLIEGGFDWLGGFISSFWGENSESLLQSLLVDGIIGGVGGVLVFLPNILLLFLAIAILEGTGYMSRAAFIMDRIMRSIGLHGNSFIPMLIGFGCTVPAIMATRTLSNKKDRFTTIMVSPLMSCGARLPIYALIIPAFFPLNWHARMLWIIYFVGIVLAIIAAKVLRMTVFKGEQESFIMELPPYRIPTLHSIIMQMWSRVVIYLKKAGTIILGISIIMWVLATFPENEEIAQKYESQMTQIKSQNIAQEELDSIIEELESEQNAEELAYTISGRIGKFIEPVIRPLGFDWKIGTAMIGAFAAKEVFVSQLGIVYSIGEADEESDTLRNKLRDYYTPLQALVIMLFALISAPCMATIAITKRETNSWKWAMAQLIGLTLLAWLVSFLVYQSGSLLGF